MHAIPKWLLIPPLVAALVVLGPLSMQSNATDGSNEPVWQLTTALIGITLAGVLLLGASAWLSRRRQRGSAHPPGPKVVSLRQTLRLSPRRAVHALELDGRIVLVGEHERGLALLEAGRLPASTGDDEHGGAVPRNLVLPRPQPMPARRPPAAVRARQGHGLNDFRALLQEAGRE
ncbi:MAG TPA: hypothetical protein VF384_11250 [Planctomycetota bacterium]